MENSFAPPVALPSIQIPLTPSGPTVSHAASPANKLAALFAEGVKEEIARMISSGELANKDMLDDIHAKHMEMVSGIELDRDSVVEKVSEIAKLFTALVPGLRSYSASVDTIRRYTPSNAAIASTLALSARGQMVSEDEAGEFIHAIMLTEIPKLNAAK